MRTSTRRLLFVGVIVLALGTSGCAGLRGKSKKTSAAAEPSRPAAASFSGTVTLVNEEGKFVLIEGRFILPPADGTRLHTFRGQTETALLSVSAEKRRPFLIADILRGSPEKGDRVVAEAVAPAPSAPASPDQPSGVPPPSVNPGGQRSQESVPVPPPPPLSGSSGVPERETPMRAVTPNRAGPPNGIPLPPPPDLRN